MTRWLASTATLRSDVPAKKLCRVRPVVTSFTGSFRRAIANAALRLKQTSVPPSRTKASIAAPLASLAAA